MIRKFAHLPAPPETVAALFAAIETWPDWMPGVERVTVEPRGTGPAVDRRRLAWIEQSFYGRRFKALVEIETGDGRLRQRQIEGPLGRWEITWRFLPGPDGSGTTLVAEIDYELGLLRFLGARRFFEKRLRADLEALFDNAARRLGPDPGPPPVEDRDSPRAAPSEAAADEVVFRLFETPRGLEAEYQGRRYHLTLIE